MSYVKPTKRPKPGTGVGSDWVPAREPRQVPLWAAVAALGIAVLVLGRKVR
jgi:hypothetical protein